MEIITGLWIAQSKQLENLDWCKSKRIQCAMNFNKYFETHTPIEINYVYIDKVHSFCKRAVEALYRAHYIENKICILGCENGRRISLLVLIFYLSSISGISKKRAFEIVKTKLPIFQLDTNFIKFIEGQ